MIKILICLLCLVMLAGCTSSGKKDNDRDDKRNDRENVIELDTSIDEATTEEISTEPSIPFDKTLCGYWVHYRDVEGTLYTIHLIINEDGTAEYKSGIANSEFTQIFSGEWNDDGGTLNFDMRGGLPQMDIENELIELEHFEGSFNWSSIGGNLLLNYATGDDFATGIPGEPYNFTRM